MSGRLGYRIAEIVRLTNLPRSTVERELQRQSVPKKRFGRAILLDPVAVETVFGFRCNTKPTVEPSPEALAIAQRLVET